VEQPNSLKRDNEDEIIQISNLESDFSNDEIHRRKKKKKRKKNKKIIS